MQTFSFITQASTVVLLTGVFWGVYWIPVRELDVLGLSGPWGTLAITLSGALLLAPFAYRRWQNPDWLTLALIAVGGAAFTFYSVGFVYGRVAVVTLLFYLTPVWSTLFTKILLGWDTPRLRYLAMGVGLAGLMLMLGATGTSPWPNSVGEWLGLASGLFWAVSSTGQSARTPLSPVIAAFVFALGGAAAALVLGLMLSPFPIFTDLPWSRIIVLAVFTGGVWWTLSIAALTWATARLDPARVGMLLLSEVLVGISTAAWLAGERLHPGEIVGGLFVLSAAVLEIMSTPTTGETGDGSKNA